MNSIVALLDIDGIASNGSATNIENDDIYSLKAKVSVGIEQIHRQESC